DMNRRLGLAHGAGTDVVPDVVGVEGALGQAGADLAVVVHDVVAHVKERTTASPVVVAQPRGPRNVVGPQVVIPRKRPVGPSQAAVAVRALGVNAAVERLGDQAPLHGDVGIDTRCRESFVHGPGG